MIRDILGIFPEDSLRETDIKSSDLTISFVLTWWCSLLVRRFFAEITDTQAIQAIQPMKMFHVSQVQTLKISN